MIVNVDILLPRLQEDFPEYKFELERQGGGWCRIFVMSKEDGASLGRINFSPTKSSDDVRLYELYGIKHYKPYDYEYAPEDDFFYQFKTWLVYGKKVPIAHLVVEAKRMKKEKIEEKLKWRENNPPNIIKSGLNAGKPRRRRKLEENWMTTFNGLVQEEMENVATKMEG